MHHVWDRRVVGVFVRTEDSKERLKAGFESVEVRVGKVVMVKCLKK